MQAIKVFSYILIFVLYLTLLFAKENAFIVKDLQ